MHDSHDWQSEAVELVQFQPPLETLYENAPGFIATASGPMHVFTFTNASYRRFVGREHLVGRTVAEALPEIVEQGILGILDRVYHTGEPFVGKDLAISILNEETGALHVRHIDVVYQPIRSNTGEVSGLFCEGYDVSDKHEAFETIATMQAQMIYVSRVNAMGTMAATLAHELNQPLCAIANYVSGALVNDNAEHDTRRCLQALRGIDVATQRAAGIISHLRELTRRREPNISTFNLKQTMDGCVRLIRATTARSIRFVDHIPPDITVTADEVKIQQVIINLLMNANEAMEGEGVITMRAWENSGALIISIADTGHGVEYAEPESIFTWSASTKAEGMGLGLAICRTIMDMHNGRIWLERSGSTGAEFRFLLPILTKAKQEDG